jgi:adenine-specific DNA-methyltransferase
LSFRRAPARPADGDSYFVRHAYFLGGKDPFERLKAALKADIDADAWVGLYATENRPFPAPKSGRIAVEVKGHSEDNGLPRGVDDDVLVCADA